MAGNWGAVTGAPRARGDRSPGRALLRSARPCPALAGRGSCAKPFVLGPLCAPGAWPLYTSFLRLRAAGTARACCDARPRGPAAWSAARSLNRFCRWEQAAFEQQCSFGSLRQAIEGPQGLQSRRRGPRRGCRGRAAVCRPVACQQSPCVLRPPPILGGKSMILLLRRMRCWPCALHAHMLHHWHKLDSLWWARTRPAAGCGRGSAQRLAAAPTGGLQERDPHGRQHCCWRIILARVCASSCMPQSRAGPLYGALCERNAFESEKAHKVFLSAQPFDGARRGQAVAHILLRYLTCALPCAALVLQEGRLRRCRGFARQALPWGSGVLV